MVIFHLILFTEDTRIAIVGTVIDATVAAFVLRMAGFKFRTCGVGVTGNYGERAKGVVCTDVDFITDPKMCKELYADAASLSFNSYSDVYCLRFATNDQNACVGDFGGPVYAYKLDSKGAVDGANQIVVCTLISSPNVRKSAHCLDGHVSLCVVTTLAVSWFEYIINS